MAELLLALTPIGTYLLGIWIGATEHRRTRRGCHRPGPWTAPQLPREERPR